MGSLMARERKQKFSPGQMTLKNKSQHGLWPWACTKFSKIHGKTHGIVLLLSRHTLEPLPETEGWVLLVVCS